MEDQPDLPITPKRHFQQPNVPLRRSGWRAEIAAGPHPHPKDGNDILPIPDLATLYESGSGEICFCIERIKMPKGVPRSFLQSCDQGYSDFAGVTGCRCEPPDRVTPRDELPNGEIFHVLKEAPDFD
jgi:hypothetical protein